MIILVLVLYCIVYYGKTALETHSKLQELVSVLVLGVEAVGGEEDQAISGHLERTGHLGVEGVAEGVVIPDAVCWNGRWWWVVRRGCGDV